MNWLRSRYVVAAIALLALACFVTLRMTDGEHGSVVASNDITINQIRGEMIASADNELRNERLPDGSEVAMSPGTRMHYDFSGQRRIVALTRGKARFTVAHDRSKPFVVQTDLLDATAVGTSFTVSATPCVRVEVHEGVVRVTGRGAAAALVTTLKADEAVGLSPNCSRAVLAADSQSLR